MINFPGRRCLVACGNSMPLERPVWRDRAAALAWFADPLRQTQDARVNLPKARE